VKAMERTSEPRIAALIARGEESGCVELSEVNELVEALSLDDTEAEALIEQVEARGIDLSDDCGRASAGHVSYVNDELSVATTDALQLFLQEVRRFPLLTAVEEIDLAKRIERGDNLAKHRMINSNLRLVVSRRGYKFSTYATWWIRQAVDRGIANGSRMIRLPSYVVERERKIARAQRSLATKLGRQPTDEEIATAARLPLSQVEDLNDVSRTVTSLDKAIGDDQQTPFGALLESGRPETAEEVEVSLREEALHEALLGLPDGHREVLRLRYGLADEDHPQTLEQVVVRLGISRNRVRKLEAEGLSRLAAKREIAALSESVELSR
jgi:RNA polymerase primary sigma factor